MYTIALSVAMVFVTIVGAGMPLTISREVAGNLVDGNKKKSFSAVSSGLIFCVTLAVIITIFVLLCPSFFELIFTQYDSYIILLTMLPTVLFTAIYTPFKGYLWGEERYTAVSIVELVEQLVRVIVCFVLFTFFSTINIMLPAGIGLSVACIASTLLGIFLYYRGGAKLANPKKQIIPIAKSCIPLTSMRIVNSLMSPLINIILPIQLINAGFSNSQALSFIGIVMGMTIPLLFAPSAIIGSLGMALIPKLSTLQKENNSLALNNQIKSSIYFTLLASILFVPIFSALGEDICTILYANTQAGAYLSSFAWMIVPLGLSQITTSILNSLGYEFQSFIYFIISSIATIILVAILPHIVGASALLISMGVGNIIIFVLNILKINKITGLNNYFIKQITIMSALCIPIILLTQWLNNILVFIFPMFICILLCCGVCIISQFLLYACFNLIDMELVTNVVIKVQKKVRLK